MVATLRGEGRVVDAFVVDVRDASAVRDAVQATRHAHDRIDLLFTCAGTLVVGETEHFTLADWREVLETNLCGVIYAVTAVYPMMIARGGGHIVNVAAWDAVEAVPGAVAYTGAKHGVLGLSLALRSEARLSGVRVSAVCPASFAGGLMGSMRTIGIDAEHARSLLRETPMPVDACVHAILDGVARNRAVIHPGVRRPWLQRHFPARARARGEALARRLLTRAGT
jgi:NADP-dependent 3-hydroxy acid dehydrogenase YdfG